MSEPQIGQKIRRLRQTQGITQKALAQAMSVADSTISNWEHGRRQPSITELMRLADFFNVTLREFEVDLSVLKDIEETDVADQPYQTIRVERLGQRVSTLRQWLIVFACLLILFGFLSSSLVSITAWISAMFIFVWSSLTRITVFLSHKTKPKKMLLSSDSSVYYEHNLDDDRIRKKRTVLTILALLGVFGAIWQYVFVLICLTMDNRLTLVMLTTLYGILTVFVGTQRLKTISSKKSMVSKQLPYHDTFGALEHHVFLIGYLFDVLALIGLSFIFLVNPLDQSVWSTHLIILINACWLTVISLSLHVQYQHFLTQFSLYVTDRKGEKTRL